MAIAVTLCLLAAIAVARPHHPLDDSSIERLNPPSGRAESPEQLLTEGHWYYWNPEKKTSTWESVTLTFRADHTVTLVPASVGPYPARSTAAWRVVSAKGRTRVLIGTRSYVVRPCEVNLHKSVCLQGPPPI